MCKQKFFRCKHCGNLLGLINDTGVPLKCCGEAMGELIPNTSEAATEKHIPEVCAKDNSVQVKVGSTAHPMTKEHHIEFIYLQTENGGQRKCLKVGSEAVARFSVVEDTPIEVYAYCNLHGLWKTDVMCACGCGKHATDCKAKNEDSTACSAEISEGCMEQKGQIS